MIEADELRIIAKDAALPASDRQVLRQAADTIDVLQKALIETNDALIEQQRRQIATNEQLIAARKAIPNPQSVKPIFTPLYCGPLDASAWYKWWKSCAG